MSEGQSARSSAKVNDLTWPVHGVVRSSVASWITTGTRSLVSFTSSSSTKPLNADARKAGSVFSG